MRPWNFSAGPSKFPEAVLHKAATEMLDWHGSGMSVMEMSHRGKEFMQIRDEAEQDLRDLLQVPDNFAVLFMQGGAQAQNALVPLNLLGLKPAAKADYVVSGSWSKKSFQEAQHFGDIQLAATSDAITQIHGTEQGALTWFPEPSTWQVRPDSSYVHVCSNETIGGVEFNDWPRLDVPLVVDVSSNILSRPIDFTKVDVAYAGAQKNAGPAGLTVVIVRKDLLGFSNPHCPNAFNYELVAKNNSMLNTPPTYSIYLAGLVFKWLKEQGGVVAIEKANQAKADLLYSYLDQSDFYRNTVAKAVRSRMNIPFLLNQPQLDELFLTEAAAAGLLQLRGHKSVGGMRASIYNAMPLEGVQALVDFMKGFEARHG
ncbi:3-phosphoserine/phosphohydroxythreonine transaminase [Paenalcaligenes hominis]|uniref:Phosphoserine aminotransferase n=1 Tax=Paenalcaligenes hominis TaxID=643674 RepID=A0ABX0WN86_9BURK|nr:3-phosphoserine/phosphohydroxythreonine transaminase [Paenalcaligenes hominis]NJB63952.1 phosphoserine aminotransferase [Paenalcaligenes hominis]GGE61890.1 phosphoserine aminotransferase [Paenalcaligenes hominis]